MGASQCCSNDAFTNNITENINGSDPGRGTTRKTLAQEPVSIEDFVDIICREEDGSVDDGFSEGPEKTPGGKTSGMGKTVTIRLDVIQHLMIAGNDEDEEEEVSRGRALSLEEVQAVAGVSFGPLPTEKPKEGGMESRIRGRKGTACMTKQQVLDLLGDLTDEEEENNGKKRKPKQNPGKAGANKPRRQTGFVNKSKLKRVLALFGETE
eukprot:TRINITY_DN74600_c0_g1_i1.p2 TRINITY_DN74600_c0_g1~~TRINITY_DN74600_c0_g1_i1.p2  ORF type:complete len:209 (+),score=50.11 TRINITY_DN74600_c0_g1_i1:173-799(+)